MTDDILKLLNPLKKEKLHEGIVSQIKSLIYSNQLGLGDKLPSERDLADLLKVSRTVVREALRSLDQSGLIEIRPGPAGGPFVASHLHKPLFESTFDLFSEGRLTLEHFFEARQAIECFSLRLAAERASLKDIEQLKLLNRKLLDDRADKTKLRENNMAFHTALADISGNPLIKLMVQSLLELLNIILPKSSQSQEFVKKTYERHETIIEAIKNQAFEQGEKMMVLDTEQTAKLSLEAYEQNRFSKSRKGSVN
jgi:GntR family transcriptional repressor for pyruvate dehydrogenase complex